MKPTLLNLETNAEFQCTGVPDALLRAQPVAWAHGTGGSARADFLRTPPGAFVLDLSVEGFTPGTPPRDVRPMLTPLEEATKPGRKGTPPPLLLTWGSINFPVLVEKVEVAYTRFDPAGFPTRAGVRVHLSELVDRTRIGAAVAGVVAAVTAPVHQLVQRMDAGRQAVTRTLRAYSDTARKQVDEVRRAADRQLAPVRQAVADAQREAKKVEAEVKAQADGVKAAGEKVVAEVKQREKELEQEVNRTKEQVGQKVEEVKKEVEGLLKGVREEVDKFGDKVKELKKLPGKVEDKARQYVNRFQGEIEKAVGDIERRANQLKRDAEAATESRAAELRATLQRLETDAKREVEDRIKTLEGKGREIAGFVEDTRKGVEGVREGVEDRLKQLVDELKDAAAKEKKGVDLQLANARAILFHEWQQVRADLDVAHLTDDWDRTCADLTRKVAELEARTNALKLPEKKDSPS